MKATDQKKEIIATRKGGFGGSDAKMFYKVGQKGIEALSDMDKRRIAVALGQIPYEDTFTTEAMEAGNEFEAWLAENEYKDRSIWENNHKISGDAFATRNFVVFAHADFYNADENIVIEAKYTSSDLEQTIADYQPQLQWYHMLGASHVYLTKGTQGDTFRESKLRKIEKDEYYISTITKGIHLIDDFCDTFIYEPKDEWGINDLLPYEQTAVIKMTSVLSEIKRMEQEAEELKSKLLETMLKHNVKSLKHDDYTLTVVPEGITSRFDKAKLLKDHPEIKESDYTTLSERKAYLKINLK